MNKKRYILVVGIILIGIVSLIFVNNKLDNKETILDEVKLKENKVDNKSFAIMIQKEDKTGYEVYEEDTWPTNAIYNNELSGCIDNYGSIIENSLSYNQETNKVTISTGVTSSCYLYFDLDKDAPIVSATVNNNNSTNATITISSNETGTYCVNTSSTITDMSNCTFSGNITKDVSVTTSIFSTGGDYYVHVKDNAGNIGHSSKLSVTLAQEIGEYLLQNPSTGLNITTAYSGMYRYIGTTANNYVKLGDVLYRVIGITTTTTRNTELGIEAGQLKVIKATSIGNYNWHTSTKTNILWESSSMYQYLNDLDSDTANQVLNNTNIIPPGWKEQIASVKWNIGDINTSMPENGSAVYALEIGNATNSSSKIGLMNLSDFYYGYNSGGTQICGSSPYCVSWLVDTTDTASWIIARYGFNSIYSSYAAWAINKSGLSNWAYDLNSSFAVRPTFYLNKDVYVTNPTATGTSTNPFILSY